MERLHIDCAKIRYKSTNKKEHIKQMMKWLTRQEEIHGFTAYLQWAVEGNCAEAIDVNIEDNKDSNQNPPVDLGDQGVHSEDVPPSGYSISKTPSYSNVPLIERLRCCRHSPLH
jgi:hypothetical protein